TAGFSSDGRVLATVARQGEISLWDVASGKRLQSLTSAPGQTNPLGNLGSMIPNPGNIKRGQIPNMANMPNMADISAMMSNVLGSMAAGTNGRTVTSVSFSQDGKILASGGIETNGQVVLWNPATGQQIATIKGHGKGINAVVFSRDAKLIASAGTDNTIK